MNRVVSIILEWVYAPENYFEGPMSIRVKGGYIVLSNGTVKAIIDPHQFKNIESTVKQIDDQVEELFHCEQVKNHKPYDLGMPFTVTIRADGSRTVSLVWPKIIPDMSVYPRSLCFLEN